MMRAAAGICFLSMALTFGGCGDDGEGDGPPTAQPVRVFAVGNKLELRYAATYADFRDKMFALVDARHPRRAELVQADVDDIAGHLRPRDLRAPERALVVFPEDVGLVAGLIGSRGEAARGATLADGGAQSAFISLILAYTPQIEYYRARFPGLPTIRYLLLATTDTFYRAAYETFRDMARTYGVYVAATFNAAPARVVRSAEAPAVVALLRDPDETAVRDFAYVADSGDVFNTTFVFSPEGSILVAAADGTVRRSPEETDGLLRGSLNKAYLTEVEQDVLPLAFGRVQDLDVLDTPVGRLASVISKDAWMMDVNDRYDAKGANLILQPEAFSEWAFAAAPWQPEGFSAGGLAHVQRNPHFLFNVTPSLTGNLFDITFDGQSAILGKRRKGFRPARGVQSAFIGQNPDSSFLRVAPWVISDPGIDHPELSLADRRAQLADVGAHLLPGASLPCATATTVGPCENGYREAIVFADLDLDAAPAPLDFGPPRPTAFGPNLRVTTAAGASRRARVAAHADRVYVVWEDDRFGYESIYLAVSADGGRRFAEHRVSDNAAGSVVELRPDVALSADGDTVSVVWQEFCAGRDDDCGRILLARFDGDGPKIGGDVRVDDGTVAGRWNPAIALAPSGEPLVAWIDERDRGPQGLALEHVYFRRQPFGATAGADVRVDAGVPTVYAAALDNRWAPSLAVGTSGVHVAWTDFRNYNWDIFTAASADGAVFAPNVRVDDAPGFERLHDHPSIAIDRLGAVHIAWADRRDTDGDTDIAYARSDDGGQTFSAHQSIDGAESGTFDPNTDTPSHQWNPQLAVSGDDVLVVWQDDRLGNNDIFSARSRDRGATFSASERVDDSGDGPSNQYRPALAIDDSGEGGRAAYVVWEDDRGGTPQIFLARRAL